VAKGSGGEDHIEENAHMKTGYRTALKWLETDRSREESFSAELEALAGEAIDSELAEILRSIARRCSKNKDKLAALIEQVCSDDYEVKLKCPVCSYGVSFGKNPKTGRQRKCLQCSIWFKLTEVDGDYVLENLGRRDGK
jgi:hypothetical protein